MLQKLPAQKKYGHLGNLSDRMCETCLEMIFLDLVLWHRLLEVICDVFAFGKILILKQGHRWMLLKGSEEHRQQRTENMLTKWAYKGGLFVIS